MGLRKSGLKELARLNFDLFAGLGEEVGMSLLILALAFLFCYFLCSGV